MHAVKPGKSDWSRGVPALSFATSVPPSSSPSPSWESLLRSPFPASPSPFSSPCQALRSQSRQTSTHVCPARKPAPTHQHLSATAAAKKPSACTSTDAQAYAHAFPDPLAKSKQLAPPFCRHPSWILMSRSLEPTTIDRGVLYRCRLGRSRCCTHAQMSERFCFTCTICTAAES